MPTQTFFDLPKRKRERILSAARQVFLSAPYEKASIQAIVEAADIPRGSFYQYFADKEDLYLYCRLERQRKTYDILYADGMDYAVHMILDDSEINYWETEWHAKAFEKLKRVMDSDEFVFDEPTLKTPANVARAYHAAEAELLYPRFSAYLKKHLESGEEEKNKLMAFVMSVSNLLYQEYMQLMDVPEDEAIKQIRKINRIIWNRLYENES